jgi:hypothetical protein
LPWFVENFWCPLVRQLPDTALKAPLVRIMFIIVANAAVAPEVLAPELRCTKEGFDSTKALELPLERWEERDIWTWLITYSGLRASLTPEQIKVTANYLYASSDNGSPNLVYRHLMQILSE